MTSIPPNPSTELDAAAASLTAESTESSLSADQYKRKMTRRTEVQQQRLAERTVEKGLIIVHTGNGKGKTTAALGIVLRSLGHGYRVAIIQFIKGAWEPAEKAVFDKWADQLDFHALGEGFTWETQDRERDIAAAQNGWRIAKEQILDPEIQFVLLDEINIALRYDYLDIDAVVDFLMNDKPPMTHVVLTGRNAKPELIEAADLVTEMTLIKHPFKDLGVKAQKGVEF